jgi:hypothetical protein
VVPILFLCAAWGGDKAYYHPTEVAGKSALFAEASEVSHPAYMKAQGDLERWDAALLHLELGSDLSGDQKKSEEAANLRKQFTIQRMKIQRHYDVLVGSYNDEFMGSLERNLPAVAGGKEAIECTERGANMFSAPTAECEGDNLNASLAKAMDADNALRKALAEINAIPWPLVQLQPSESLPIAVTGTGHWIDLPSLALGLRGEKLQYLRDERDASLEQLTEGLEAGDKETIAAAKKIDLQYRSAVRDEGKLLIQAIELAVEKQSAKISSLADVGFCVQPSDLGSCTGTEASQEALDAVRSTRKARKLLGL